jgi:hypothetical protein
MQAKFNGMEAIAIISVLLTTVAAVWMVMCLLFAWPFMWLWNGAVCAAVTVANPIGYWTSFWLLWFIGVFARSSKATGGVK